MDMIMTGGFNTGVWFGERHIYMLSVGWPTRLGLESKQTPVLPIYTDMPQGSATKEISPSFDALCRGEITLLGPRAGNL